MGPTILIIDDDEGDILLTKRSLLKIDPELRVEAALGGEAGLTFLRETKEIPALVLLDLKMPGLNGFETLHQMRAEERLRQVPVVVLTSSDLPSDLERAHAAGAARVLQKSLGDRFRKELEAVLELRHK